MNAPVRGKYRRTSESLLLADIGYEFHSLDGFSNLLWIVVSKPHDDPLGMRVNPAHHGNLMALLHIVVLVDAKGIRPYCARSVWESQPRQSVPEVHTDRNRLAVPGNLHGSFSGIVRSSCFGYMSAA